MLQFFLSSFSLFMKMSHFAARSDGVQHSEEARQDLGSLLDTASQVSSLTSSNRSPQVGKKRKRQEGEGEEASPPMSLSGLSSREHSTLSGAISVYDFCMQGDDCYFDGFKDKIIYSLIYFS